MTALSSAIFVTPFLDGARRFTRIRLKLVAMTVYSVRMAVPSQFLSDSTSKDIRGGLRPNGLVL
ncbi:hypothetical protein GX48_01684 [Paracoccidioides brasiliensis]|nr:hypothetical protein GX48_01684 [Paracoccidioides brasiliensis]